VGLREVVARHELFCALYTDRGSHYFLTPKAGEKVSKSQLTQVGRALKQLGIEHIAAYSPQARGRSERAFRTLQDRLPKELRLAGIKSVAQANRWLAKTYLPAHNAAFAIAAEQEGSAFLKDRSAAWAEILCVQDERVVGNDNTVKWNRLCLQLPQSRLRPHFVKATVCVHECPDGSLAVFLGPHRLVLAPSFHTARAKIEVAAPRGAMYALPPKPDLALAFMRTRPSHDPTIVRNALPLKLCTTQSASSHGQIATRS
jgi:hypothetical protein